MNFHPLKKEEKEILKKLIITHIYNNEKNIFNNEIPVIKGIVKKYTNLIKLDKLDLKILNEEITNKILFKKNFILTKETNTIIKILSNKLKNYTLNILNNDEDIVIYFHLKNNTSYLINYDYLEEKWYISLIETTSLNLLKEIYGNNFLDFIKYIENKRLLN